MALVKRGKYYYTRFTAPDGKRVFQTTRATSKRDAQEYEDALKSRLWREVQLGESQATWKNAVVSWLKATDHKDRAKVVARLRWLDSYLGELSLREIDSGRLHALRDAKLAEGSKPATVNRYLAIVSAVLRHGHSRGWLESTPSIPRMTEPKGRLRWLREPEAALLIERLRKTAPHVADMAEFALMTGLRESNIVGLRWEWLQDGIAWIPTGESKSGRPIRAPLNAVAREVVKRQRGKHKVWVFTYRGKPVTRCNNTAFRKAVADCGLEDVRFHTLRHTWASWQVMAGTPVEVLRELGGWSDLRMVLRYAHLAPGYADQFSEKVVQKWRKAYTDKP